MLQITWMKGKTLNNKIMETKQLENKNYVLVYSTRENDKS
jgi:hypothetical protein